MVQDFATFFSMKSLIVFILVLSRIGGMLSTAPLFSTFPIPSQAKVGLAALVSFIMYPIVLSAAAIDVPKDLFTLSLLMTKEILVGVLIGFCALIIFIGIQMAGHLLSIQMGLAVGNILDPVTKQQVPVVGQFYMYMASIAFIYINGHHWLFTSILDSYAKIPIGVEFVINPGIVERVIYLTGQMFNIAFSVIMPIFGVLFIVDIALGFLSKIMPQMNVFMVAIPLKVYIAFLLMILFMSSTTIYLTTLIQNMLQKSMSIFT